MSMKYDKDKPTSMNSCDLLTGPSHCDILYKVKNTLFSFKV